ncbi:MAG: lipocalin family protein [Alistipes sp.]|nr:lipocalin family protein [Alistipes sp.]
MKSLKIFALAMLAVVAFVGCKPGNGPEGDGKSLSGEWKLATWNDTTPEFNVYIDFNADGTFEMYQQVWSLDYELFKGTYTIEGNVVSGVYDNGAAWACDYEYVLEEQTLTLHSRETVKSKSVYEKCTIPEQIKAEASATRSSEVVPFL